MEAWLKKIMYFYIMSSLFMSIFPSKQYEKIIKMFLGLILIFLIVNPIFNLLGEDGLIINWLNRAEKSLYLEDEKISMKLEGIDEVNMITKPYMDAIKKDIEDKAWEYALYVNLCVPVIEMDVKSKECGQIISIDLEVCETKNLNTFEKIEVKVDGDDVKKGNNENQNVKKLKNYICSSYKIDEENVNITLK